MPHSILALQNVSLIRNNKDGSPTTILHDFSYVFPHEQISAIIGASGSGKSSLLRLINRLDEPSAGTILFRDKNIATLSPLLLRQQIGMVMQKSFMFEGTVLENLQRPFLYRNSKPPTANSTEIARVLELAQLPEALLLRDAQSLSGGEQQRLNLARTLLTKPHVLLLDEPTSALDRPATTRLATILHTLCRTEQLTIIVVTHDLYFAEICSHHLLYVEKGCLRENGATAEMLASPKTTAFTAFLATPEKHKETLP